MLVIHNRIDINFNWKVLTLDMTLEAANGKIRNITNCAIKCVTSHHKSHRNVKTSAKTRPVFVSVLLYQLVYTVACVK